MKSEADILELLTQLNPPKQNASAETWSPFYLKKGFDVATVGQLIELLQSELDDFNMELLDADGDPYDNVLDCTVYVDRITHLFRINMSLGTTNHKEETLSSIFRSWPFDIYPELSDDISRAAALAKGDLDGHLATELNRVMGDPAREVVKTNAAITALRESEAGRATILSVLHRFDEYYPDVVAVAFLIVLKDKSLKPQDLEVLRFIHESDYISFLGIDDSMLQRVRPEVLQRSSWTMEAWVENRQWNFESYLKCLRWYGVEGLQEEHLFRFLGFYLVSNKPMKLFWKETIEDSDVVTLSAYPSVFKNFVNKKSDYVSANFVKELSQLDNFFEIGDSEKKHSLSVVCFSLAGFLSVVDEKHGNLDFIKTLSELAEKLWVKLEGLSTEAIMDFRSDAETVALVQMVHDRWQDGFREFCNRLGVVCAEKHRNT